MPISAADAEHAKAKLNRLHFIADGAEDAMLPLERESMGS